MAATVTAGKNPSIYGRTQRKARSANNASHPGSATRTGTSCGRTGEARKSSGGCNRKWSVLATSTTSVHCRLALSSCTSLGSSVASSARRMGSERWAASTSSVRSDLASFVSSLPCASSSCAHAPSYAAAEPTCRAEQYAAVLVGCCGGLLVVCRLPSGLMAGLCAGAARPVEDKAEVEKERVARVLWVLDADREAEHGAPKRK
eukprot:CAMPEP_0179843594 /NCGR_PEP_ID=MMETSP0982-20121206/3805_1 /TAXON_ID=483367 /ORGANISM="non described non described, Strain CCMP 2436" /LENGTH=203 /DNA_ID=CAMNT_0021728067 /DNA_START=2313 /DNA_END=2923 /DNA_ORIENTATION=+